MLRSVTPFPEFGSSTLGSTAIRRFLTTLALLALSWYAMLACHEAGHVLAACATGGTVQRVVLLPWAFSRTDVGPNPHPVAVLWAGPLFGGLFPLLIVGATWRLRPELAKGVGLFGGFCLIANGAYLATAPLFPAGDTEDLLRLGTSAAILAAVGIPMFCSGLWLWHVLGKRGFHELQSDLRRSPRSDDGPDRHGPGRP